jgi:hypothetical protein
MEYGLTRDPEPLPDRPDFEGGAWREAVQLGHLQGDDRDEMLDMLAKHRSTWSGRPGQVQSTNHHIDLISANTRCNASPTEHDPGPGPYNQHQHKSSEC